MCRVCCALPVLARGLLTRPLSLALSLAMALAPSVAMAQVITALIVGSSIVKTVQGGPTP